MGRPIKKTFFGNLNREFYGSVPRLSGVGGEGVVSIAITNSGTNYSAGSVLAFTAADITGGIKPTASLTVGTGAILGNITNIAVSDSGSGYNAAPTVTITTASSVTVAGTGTSATTVVYVTTSGIFTGMRVTGTGISSTATYVSAVNAGNVTVTQPNTSTVSGSLAFTDIGSGFANSVTMTTTRLSAIQIISYITTGSSAISGGDIVKQESSRRYLVNNAQGQGQCRLATGVLAAGQMHIIATDWGGATYYVTKLTAHRAIVTPRTSTSTAYISTGSSAAWTIGSATGTGVSAVLSLSHTS